MCNMWRERKEFADYGMWSLMKRIEVMDERDQAKQQLANAVELIMGLLETSKARKFDYCKGIEYRKRAAKYAAEYYAKQKE
jgi:hypothetical protein